MLLFRVFRVLLANCVTHFYFVKILFKILNIS